jgi:hypothetical protein
VERLYRNSNLKSVSAQKELFLSPITFLPTAYPLGPLCCRSDCRRTRRPASQAPIEIPAPGAGATPPRALAPPRRSGSTRSRRRRMYADLGAAPHAFSPSLRRPASTHTRRRRSGCHPGRAAIGAPTTTTSPLAALLGSSSYSASRVHRKTPAPRQARRCRSGGGVMAGSPASRVVDLLRIRRRVGGISTSPPTMSAEVGE